MRASVVPASAHIQFLLAEGPLWDHRSQCLYFVDILDNLICWFKPPAQVFRISVLPFLSPSFVAFTCNPDQFFVACSTGMLMIYVERCPVASEHSAVQVRDMVRVPLQGLVLRNGGRPLRLNDGKVCPSGSSMVAGTMQEKRFAAEDRDIGSASVYVIQPPTAVKLSIIGPVTLSNGLDWSLDGNTLYFIDTAADRIVSVPWEDPQGGSVEVLWELEQRYRDQGSRLDGMCVDAQGQLWVALIGGGLILRIDPLLEHSARVTLEVTIPGAPLVTSCCFGGADLRTLFVTTATRTTHESCHHSGVNGGKLFSVDMDGVASGRVANYFNDGENNQLQLSML